MGESIDHVIDYHFLDSGKYQETVSSTETSVLGLKN